MLGLAMFSSPVMAQTHRQKPDPCKDTSNMTQGGINDCAVKELHKAELKLEKLLNQLGIRKDSAEQKAWEAYRDAQLAAIYPQEDISSYGSVWSVYPMCLAILKKTLTEGRIRDRSPSHRTYTKSAVMRSNFSSISQGRGTNDVSVSAKATLCSRSTSANFASSHFLFLISTANLWSVGSFFRKGASTARKLSCFGNFHLSNTGNWKTIGPSFGPRISIVLTNSSNSESQSTNAFSCVMICGTLTEN